jgi:hypothetical protein
MSSSALSTAAFADKGYPRRLRQRNVVTHAKLEVCPVIVPWLSIWPSNRTPFGNRITTTPCGLTVPASLTIMNGVIRPAVGGWEAPLDIQNARRAHSALPPALIGPNDAIPDRQRNRNAVRTLAARALPGFDDSLDTPTYSPSNPAVVAGAWAAAGTASVRAAIVKSILADKHAFLFADEAIMAARPVRVGRARFDLRLPGG